MDQKIRSRRCFVPECNSSTRKTPDKEFFCVPKDPATRKLWFQSVGRQDEPKEKSTHMCCEDHFNLPDDMDNYVKFSLVGGTSKILKKTAIPRWIFTESCTDRHDELPRTLEPCVHSTVHVRPKNAYEGLDTPQSPSYSPRRLALGNITNAQVVVTEVSKTEGTELDMVRQPRNVEDGNSPKCLSEKPALGSFDKSCVVDLNQRHFNDNSNNSAVIREKNFKNPIAIPLCKKDDLSESIPKETSNYTAQSCDKNFSKSKVKIIGTVTNKNGVLDRFPEYNELDNEVRRMTQPMNHVIKSLGAVDDFNNNGCQEQYLSFLGSWGEGNQECCNFGVGSSAGPITSQWVEENEMIVSETNCDLQSSDHNNSNECSEAINDSVIMIDVGIQVRKSLTKPHTRSRRVQCKLVVSSAGNQCQTNIVDHVDRACSPILPASQRIRGDSLSALSSMGSTLTNSTLDYEPSQSEYGFSSSTEEEERKPKVIDMKEVALNMIRYQICVGPKRYIGIDPEWMWIVEMLSTETKCSADNIKLTLMEIRLNDTFSRLGDQFGVSEPQASRIFGKTIESLAHFLQTLALFPELSHIKKNLPIAYRARYSHVFGIIDAFEIQMEKPSNPVHQSLSWSEYKKGNTVKYVILCTADGLICFVSDGYGGKISDCALVEESQLLDKLPENCAIMADRGFKNLQTVLAEKNCILLRPPSVSKASKPSKEEVLETKDIASLRIHVERVIRRVREFTLLGPHACVDSNLLNYLDSAVIVAAGLINLQKPIIKK